RHIASGRGAGDRLHHRDGVRRRSRLRHRSLLRVGLAAATRRLVQRARRDRGEPPPAALRVALRERALRSGRRVRRRSRSASHARRAPVANAGAVMPLLTMRQDFRAPTFGPASTPEIYAAGLEQMRWADAHGFDFLVLSEHHGIDDGWMPAPLTMAGMVLAQT